MHLHHDSRDYRYYNLFRVKIMSRSIKNYIAG